MKRCTSLVVQTLFGLAFVSSLSTPNSILNSRSLQDFDNGNKDELRLYDRRSIFQNIGASFAGAGCFVSFPMKAMSEEFENGLLESRVTEDLMSKVPYSIEAQDIFYPGYFKGVWDVTSVTTDVEAPCGKALFGGNATYDAALAEIGPSGALNYRARFIESSVEGKTIADREFNVVEISKAAMGVNAVVNVPVATPNKFCCLLAPSGANNLFTVDLITAARRVENISDNRFDCAELVRQIVASPSSKGSQGVKRQPSIKDIEAVSLYIISEADPNGMVKEIKCRQRIATYVAPIQEDPLSMKMWQYSRGRPIDVRFYDITYTKKS